jgi:hypothetical protein
MTRIVYRRRIFLLQNYFVLGPRETARVLSWWDIS